MCAYLRAYMCIFCRWWVVTCGRGVGCRRACCVRVQDPGRSKTAHPCDLGQSQLDISTTTVSHSIQTNHPSNAHTNHTLFPWSSKSTALVSVSLFLQRWVLPPSANGHFLSPYHTRAGAPSLMQCSDRKQPQQQRPRPLALPPHRPPPPQTSRPQHHHQASHQQQYRHHHQHHHQQQ